MKRFILILLMFIFNAPFFAQITMTIENVNATAGNNVPIALNVTNFDNVGAISIRITYDTNVLEFDAFTNKASSSISATGANGIINIFWFDATGGANPLNLGNTKLGDLVFNYLGGTSQINFQGPPVTEISNANGQSIALTLVNGSITGGAPPAIGTPTLETPINGATNQSLTPTLNWSDVANATQYDLQVSSDPAFTAIVVDQQDLGTSLYSVPASTLTNSNTYYWRARAENSQTTGAWSSAFSFTTIAGGGGGTDVSVTIGTITAPPNTEIKVPLTVENFNSIGSISLRIIFDNTKLTFKSIVNKTDKTISGNPNGNRLTLFWFDGSGGASPLNAGNGELLELVFDYTDTSLPLTFDLAGCEITNSSNQVLTSTFNDGLIVEGDPLPSVPTLNFPSNGQVDVSLMPTLEWNASTNTNSYSLQLATDNGFSNLVVDQTGITNTSLVVPSNLLQDTQYFWRVNATGNSGTSAYSDTWSFTTLLPPLPPPDLVTPADASTDVSLTPELDWSDVNEATSYSVQVSFLPDFSDLNVGQTGLVNSNLSLTAGTLQEGVTYYWRANATDGNRVSDWSTVFSFTTLITTLDLPVLLSPADGSMDLDPVSVVLDWTDITDATDYEMHLSETSDFSSFAAYGTSESQVSLDLLDITFGKQYFWKVKATNATKESEFTLPWSFSTMLAPLGVPNLIAPADGAINLLLTLTLDWSNVANATSYGLQVATDESFNNLAIDASGLDESQYAIPDGNLSFETMYYWRVNASDDSRTGEWSEVRDFTTEPSTGIEVYSSGIPDDFALLQNYPNPFNPSTNIRFALPEASEVKVAVVDLLGREVSVLYDGIRPAGFFELNWDASNISSGTYIYKINAKSVTGQEFSQMKKMMFVK
jgi:hypothetical protein